MGENSKDMNSVGKDKIIDSLEPISLPVYKKMEWLFITRKSLNQS